MTLNPATTPANPLKLFASWLDDAIKDKSIKEPNAMCLSTVGKGATAKPHSRMVLLKDVKNKKGEQGFVFFTNYESAKGDELAKNSNVALNFWWPPYYRQVRVEGKAKKTSAAETAAYFSTRDRDSRISAWASPQSRTLPNYKKLQELLAKREAEFKGKDVPVPPYWGGYLVVPKLIEFWEGRASRLHYRVLYTKQGGSTTWKKKVLAP